MSLGSSIQDSPSDPAPDFLSGALAALRMPTGHSVATRPAELRPPLIEVKSEKFKMKGKSMAGRLELSTFHLQLFTAFMARPRGLEPLTLGLAYQLLLSQPAQQPRGLWSGLSLRHLRRRTYSLYGSPRRFPRDCHQHYLEGFPVTVRSTLAVQFPGKGSTDCKGRCSIHLSYGRI